MSKKWPKLAAGRKQAQCELIAAGQNGPQNEDCQWGVTSRR